MSTCMYTDGLYGILGVVYLHCTRSHATDTIMARSIFHSLYNNIGLWENSRDYLIGTGSYNVCIFYHLCILLTLVFRVCLHFDRPKKKSCISLRYRLYRHSCHVYCERFGVVNCLYGHLSNYRWHIKFAIYLLVSTFSMSIINIKKTSFKLGF